MAGRPADVTAEVFLAQTGIRAALSYRNAF